MEGSSFGGESNSTGQATPASELYVEESPSDLPANPDTVSFAVTGDGLFQHDGTNDGWDPVRYGSESAAIPEIIAQMATFGSDPTGRPLISNERQVVYVDPDDGDDSADGSESAPLETVQEAVNRAPIYLRHQYQIDLATVPDLPATYDEDVLVPALIGTGRAGKENGAPQRGPYLNLVIRGDSDDVSAVQLGSIMFGNVIGSAAGNVSHLTITRDSPYDDEQFGLSAYGNSEVNLYNIAFAEAPTNGILAYGARIKADRIDFGQGSLEIGLMAKRHASVIIDQSEGESTNDAFRSTENSKITVREDNSVSGDPTYNPFRGGLLFDEGTDVWYGIPDTASTETSEEPGTPTESRLRMQSTHPDAPSPGEIWYVDGSGEVSEGFYGQLESGVVKLE